MKQLNFPPMSEIEEALQWYLAEHGPCRSKDVYGPMAMHFKLTFAQAVATPVGSSDPVWRYKVRWARQSLKNKGLLAKTANGIWDVVREEQQKPAPMLRIVHAA